MGEQDGQTTPQPGSSDIDAHTWHCWGTPDGPGARRLADVHQELKIIRQDAAVAQEKTREEMSSIKSRITWYNGGVAVLSAIGMIVLAAWLSSKFAATERSAVKREDVAAAVQQSANMAVARQADDFMKFKAQMEQAAADVSLSPTFTKARK
jgi:hypothetical protein